MAECDFSWFKIASFFGAAVLAVLAFILIGSGINQILGGSAAYGVASIIGGCLSGAVACWVYKKYQRKGNK